MEVLLVFENKKIEISSNTLIKKSTEMARTPMKLIEMNKSLNIKQQRLFNLAILSIGDDGWSRYKHSDYAEIFGDKHWNYSNEEMAVDCQAVGTLGFLSKRDNRVNWKNVFQEVDIDLDTKEFCFQWASWAIDHVRDLKNNYIQQDLKVLAHFRNKYSFILYDFFKSNYRQWKWTVSKENLIDMLNIEEKKSYLDNHAMLFKQCIESPLKELNEFTEYNITVEVIRKGRVIVGYEFKRFTENEVVYSVTSKQLNVLKEIIDRYGDTGAIIQEIASFAVVDADAVPYLTGLYFEIQIFKRYIAVADTFTADSFNDVVKLAIQKDNAFKAKLRELYNLKSDRPTIDDFIQEQPTKTAKPIFYNWLDEREL